VLAARQADEDDRVALAVVRPLPGQIVELDVQVPDPGRDVAGSGPADGNDAKVSRRYGMKTTPWASGPGSGGSTVRLTGGSLSMLTTVLCAKAPATSRMVAATAASVLMRRVIARSPLGKLTA
jgi:hypothetical protein